MKRSFYSHILFYAGRFCSRNIIHILYVPRFTPTKLDVARIHQDAYVDKLAEVIPKMDDLNTGKGSLDKIESKYYVPENERLAKKILRSATFHRYFFLQSLPPSQTLQRAILKEEPDGERRRT